MSDMTNLGGLDRNVPTGNL